MPWFSRRKRKKKTEAPVAGTSVDDSMLPLATCPSFTVVLQGFETSVDRGLSVTRGQVLETLYTRGKWSYVRNVDGQCGYIPTDFCFPLNKLRTSQNSQNGSTTQVVVYPRPTTIHVDNFEGEQGAGGHRGGTEVEVEEEGEVNSPDSGISCSQPTDSSNGDFGHSLCTSNQRSRGGRNNTARTNPHHQTREAAELNSGYTDTMPERQMQHLQRSTLPLLETATSSAPGSSREQLNVPRSRLPSPSPPPLPPVNLTELQRHKDIGTPATSQLSGAEATAATGATWNGRNGQEEVAEAGQRSRRSSYSSEADDVFLPESGKPVGIYQSMATYEAKFQGELSLKKDEIIVVMEVGKGEWVRAVGSDQREGLVPKELLHKYRPDEEEDEGEEEEEEGVDGREASGGASSESVQHVIVRRRRMSESVTYSVATSATQTELIINGIVREVSSSSSSSDEEGRRRECGCARAVAASTPPRIALETINVAVQTEFTSPNWFKDNSPTPTPTSTSPHHTVATSTSTRPTLNPSHPHAACVTSSMTQATPPHPPSTTPTRASFLPLVPRVPSIIVQSPGGSGTQAVLGWSAHSAGGTGGGADTVRQRQALWRHRHIVNSVRFQPENNASISLPVFKRRVQPTPIVTALKDYTPSGGAGNVLAVHQGDIFYAQPHVPYPHGFVWVYHTTARRYGYVPTDHIAYLYLVQRNPSSVQRNPPSSSSPCNAAPRGEVWEEEV